MTCFRRKVHCIVRQKAPSVGFELSKRRPNTLKGTDHLEEVPMTVQAGRSVKHVYRFDEGNASMTDLLGGKGSNLCELAQLGLPVPPGFIITTQVCRDYLNDNHTLPTDLVVSIQDNIKQLERSIGRSFGSTASPLLVSVR